MYEGTAAIDVFIAAMISKLIPRALTCLNYIFSVTSSCVSLPLQVTENY